MMRSPNFTKQFEKYLKRMRKHGKNLQKLSTIMAELIDEKPLEKQYKDHILIGNYKGREECHPEPDCLLIYKLADNEIILNGQEHILIFLNKGMGFLSDASWREVFYFPIV